MKRKIAVFLSALMLWSTVAGSVNVAAAEVQENSNTTVETQNDNEDINTISQDDSGVNYEMRIVIHRIKLVMLEEIALNR